jgi:hypothetical protein
MDKNYESNGVEGRNFSINLSSRLITKPGIFALRSGIAEIKRGKG